MSVLSVGTAILDETAESRTTKKKAEIDNK